MRGKLILVPVKEPKEGMKVVFGRNPDFSRTETIERISGHTIFIKNSGEVRYHLHELQQIAIEYYKDASYIADRPHVFPKATMLIEKVEKAAILLSPDDYEKALPLIGQEVEFEEDLDFNLIGRLEVDGELIDVETGTIVGKLITPSPIVYTEEEVRELVRDAMSEADKNGILMPDEWFDKHKKK